MIKIIKDNNLDEVKASKYAVVDFSATWCGPCRMVAPAMEELSEELAGEVDFFNCDVDENMELAQKQKAKKKAEKKAEEEAKEEAKAKAEAKGKKDESGGEQITISLYDPEEE